jgi:predicted transcriptional regulator
MHYFVIRKRKKKPSVAVPAITTEGEAVRRDLYEFIRAHPGEVEDSLISYLVQQKGISKGDAKNALALLEVGGLIEKKRIDQYDRYYTKEEPKKPEEKVAEDYWTRRLRLVEEKKRREALEREKGEIREPITVEAEAPEVEKEPKIEEEEREEAKEVTEEKKEVEVEKKETIEPLYLRLAKQNQVLYFVGQNSLYKNKLQVPYKCCRKGIAKELGLPVNTVGTILSRLRDAGLVMDKKLHVEGEKFRQKIYFLTPKGEEHLKILLEKARTSE